MLRKFKSFFSRIFGNKYVDLEKIQKTKDAGLIPVFNSNKNKVVKE